MKKNKTSGIILILLCLAGFIINFITYYPGFMSPDSFDQYSQALAGKYNTWHPPFMAFVWRVLNFLHKGPQLMLALQLLYLWVSCYLLASSFGNWIWRIFILLVFFFAPFIQNFSGYIIKDSQMALSWLVAVTILFNHIKTNGRHIVATGIVSALFLLYGDCVRYNAPAGLLPLCFGWGWIIFSERNRLTRILVSLGLFVLIICGGRLINYYLHPSKSYPESVLYVYDLTGNFIRTHKNVYPDVLYTNPAFDTAYIRSHYDTSTIDNLVWNSDNKIVLIPDSSTTEALRTAWITSMVSSPGTYLKVRYVAFLYFLKLRKNDAVQYYFPWIHPNPYGFVIHGDKKLYKRYVDYMTSQKDYVYFKPWFWLLVNILLFAFVPLLKDPLERTLYLSLITSALLYTLPQFFLCTTAKDFRYLYWTCIACTVAFMLVVAKLFKK